MKYISQFLSLLLLLQAFAWAANPQGQVTAIQLETAIVKYNALSQAEKMELFKEAMKTRPKEDQDAFEPYLKELEKMDLPKAEVRDGTIQVQKFGSSLTFGVSENSEIIFKGEVIDFGPGKVQAGLKKLEALQAPKTTMLDFFISSAHAELILAAMLIATVAAAVALTIWHYLKNPYDFGKDCNFYKKVVTERWSEIDDLELEYKVQQTIRGLSHWKTKLSCSTKQHEHCPLAQNYIACFQDLAEMIEAKQSAKVNNSSRDQRKDVPASPKAKPRTSPARAIST